LIYDAVFRASVSERAYAQVGWGPEALRRRSVLEALKKPPVRNARRLYEDVLWDCVFLLLLLSLAQSAGSQDPYPTTRSLEVQRAIGHVAEAEFYTRMALRSLEASEKAGRAPFFDYERAREDLKRILGEFKLYLSGDGSPAKAAAIPVVIDGTYFSESIKDYLLKRKPSGLEAVPDMTSKKPERKWFK